MTELTKTIRRTVQTARHGRIVIEATPEGLVLRKAGHRTRYGPLDYGWLFLTAATKTADAQRLKRRARHTRSLLGR